MTPNEFNEWLRHHGRCVGGLDDWLAKGRSDDERREVLKLWATALDDVSLDDAKRASMAMMKGDLEEPAFGKHPATIRRFCRDKASERSKINRQRRQFRDGHEVFDCHFCQDTGYVTCYHPSAISEFLHKRDRAFAQSQTRTQKEPRRIMPALNTCAYPCKCSEGFLKRRDGQVVFDPERCVRVTAVGTGAMIDELVRECDRRVSGSVAF